MTGIEHPDHTGASSNPSAPWNQGDPDPLICDVCGDEPEEGDGFDEGDACRWSDALSPLPCDGHYESKRCTECNSIACHCP